MAYKVIIDPVASLDIIDTMEWYNNAQAGLGVMFYKQVQAIFKAISKNPYIFAIRYKTSHTALVKKFPYMVHYFTDAENKTVIVYSVLHTSRDPQMWNERLENA